MNDRKMFFSMLAKVSTILETKIKQDIRKNGYWFKVVLRWLL